MATASPKAKFDAAVKVIHSLPKNGPFQPSKEMMLLFYGYYKQATEGPCKSPKPSFWDVVKKAKWEAWSKLGDMAQEVAMLNYVEELKKTLKDGKEQWDEMSKKGDPRIVEAMPQTQVVGDFMTVLGSFYEIVDEDAKPGGVMSNGVPFDDGYNTEPSSSTDTSGEQDTLESNAPDDSDVSVQDTVQLEDEDLRSDDDDDDDDVDDQHLERHTGQLNGNTEKRSNLSSDSEEEFCDTSADLENFLLRQGNETGQNGSILSHAVPVKPLKTNHVRFADTNGRMSPTNTDNENVENIHVAQGFPFISSGSVEGEEMVTMETASVLNSVDSIVPSGKLKGNYSMKLVEANTTGNNSNVVDVVDEGDEPPDDKGKGNRGAEKDQKTGQGARRSGSSRPNLQGSGGRRALLGGGGGAGGGAGGRSGEQGPSSGSSSFSNEQITTILIRLQQDMANVLDRLNRLEVQSRQAKDRSSRNSVFNFWPFTSQTGRAAFFILVWPVLVHMILTFMFRRRRKK